MRGGGSDLVESAQTKFRTIELFLYNVYMFSHSRSLGSLSNTRTLTHLHARRRLLRRWRKAANLLPLAAANNADDEGHKTANAEQQWNDAKSAQGAIGAPAIIVVIRRCRSGTGGRCRRR